MISSTMLPLWQGASFDDDEDNHDDEAFHDCRDEDDNDANYNDRDEVPTATTHSSSMQRAKNLICQCEEPVPVRLADAAYDVRALKRWVPPHGVFVTNHAAHLSQWLESAFRWITDQAS
jgi:hypothetical protein